MCILLLAFDDGPAHNWWSASRPKTHSSRIHVIHGFWSEKGNFFGQTIYLFIFFVFFYVCSRNDSFAGRSNWKWSTMLEGCSKRLAELVAHKHTKSQCNAWPSCTSQCDLFNNFIYFSSWLLCVLEATVWLRGGASSGRPVINWVQQSCRRRCLLCNGMHCENEKSGVPAMRRIHIFTENGQRVHGRNISNKFSSAGKECLHWLCNFTAHTHKHRHLTYTHSQTGTIPKNRK